MEQFTKVPGPQYTTVPLFVPSGHSALRRKEPKVIATPKVARLLAILALAATVSATVVVARGTYNALADAWVAPMQLSPDSREVVAFKFQAAKQKEERARLEGEVTTATAEIAVIDLGLKNLRRLAEGYGQAVRQKRGSRQRHLAGRHDQGALLERQRTLAMVESGRDQVALSRARRELQAGVITTAQVQAAESALVRSELTRTEKELEYLRVTTDLDVQMARLEADQRAAEGRRRAAQTGLAAMEELQRDLASTPLFLALQREVDLAFVPYSHLKKVREGDAVYHCRWLIFDCAGEGRIKRIFPGEVVMDDPWGSPARGRYVELQMSNRRAMNERTLRVRPAGPSATKSSTTEGPSGP